MANKTSKEVVILGTKTNGLVRTAYGKYEMNIKKGSKKTVLFRKKQILDKQTNRDNAKAIYRFWYSQQLAEYEIKLAEFNKAKQLGDALTFAEFTYQDRNNLAADGQFFRELKNEVKLGKSLTGHRAVSNMAVIKKMRPMYSMIKEYPEFANKPLPLITPDDVNDLLDSIKEQQQVKNNTVNHYKNAISKAFDIAIGLKLVSVNPVNKVHGRPKEYREKTGITAGMYSKVLTVLEQLEDPMLKAAYILLLTSGIRRGELMALCWKDIDFERGRISVYKRMIDYTDDDGNYVRTLIDGTKNGAIRETVLAEPAKKALMEYKKKWDADAKRSIKQPYTWTDEVSGKEWDCVWMNPDRLGPYTLDYFGQDWAQSTRYLLVDAGAVKENTREHDFRAGFINFLLGTHKLADTAVSKLAGHKSTIMTLDVYGNADDSDTQQALDQINDAI